jgi:hypothetical protein
LFVRWESYVNSLSSANSQCFQQLSRWKEGSCRRPAVPMLKALSDRQAGDSVPKLARPEFDSLARVEDAGCLKNWWGNLSPDTRTAFADEGDETGRGRRQV